MSVYVYRVDTLAISVYVCKVDILTISVYVYRVDTLTGCLTLSGWTMSLLSQVRVDCRLL